MAENHPASTINTAVDGIGHFISDRMLAIPDYQRSYSWTLDEVEELWNDLRKAIDRGLNEYFLGSVVTTKSGNSERMLVIDGQQRLATISILLTAMRDILRERSDERADDIERDFLGRKDLKTRQLKHRLTLNADDNQFFADLIAGKNPEPARGSHKRIRAAYDFLYQEMTAAIGGLSAEEWQDPLLDIHQFIETGAKIIDVHVPDENRSFVIFETLNDRGLNLNTADLLKNHLFGSSGDSLEETKRRWSEMTGALGVDENVDTVSDSFLRHYWSTVTGTGRSKALFTEMRDSVESPTQAVKLASDLAIAAPLWAGMLDAESEYWSKARPITKENLRVLKALKVEQVRPLLLAAMSNMNRSDVEKLIEVILSWTVRWFVAGGGGAGTTERLYAETGRKIASGEISDIEEIIQAIQPRVPSDKEFETSFVGMSVRRGWLARYYLIALERTLRTEEGLVELEPTTNYESANLEHVLPKSFHIDAWPQFSESTHSDWVLALGNQAVLATSENTLIGNESFSVKAPVLAKSELKLTREIAESVDWNPATIESRQKRLASLAVKTWPLS